MCQVLPYPNRGGRLEGLYASSDRRLWRPVVLSYRSPERGLIWTHRVALDTGVTSSQINQRPAAAGGAASDLAKPN